MDEVRQRIMNEVKNFKATTEDNKVVENNEITDNKDNKDIKEVKPLEINWEEFNKNTEGEFKSFDDIKNLRKQAKEYETKIKEYEPVLKEHQTLKQQLEEKEGFIKENLNPLKAFGGKTDRYVKYQLEEKYPEKESLISDVMNISKLSDIDAIILEKQWNNPETDENDIVEYLNNKYDTSLTDLLKTKPEEWDSKIRFMIKEDARVARATLGGIPSEIELPDDPTIINKQKEDEKVNKQKQDEATWKNLTSSEGFAERVFGEYFSKKYFTKKDEKGNPEKGEDGKELPPYLDWKVEPEVLKQFPERVSQFVKDRGISPTEENLARVMQHFVDGYFIENKDKMFAKHEESLLAKWKAQKANEDFVPANLNLNRGDATGKPGERDLSKEAYENFGKKRKMA
jgi:hypothetical protein